MSYKESLSPSRSWVYTVCKRRYSLKYLERVKPLVRDQSLKSWLRLFRGQTIHSGLEAVFLNDNVEAYVDNAINEELAKGLRDEQKAELNKLRFESVQIAHDLAQWLPAEEWAPYRHNGQLMVESAVRAPLPGFPGGFLGYVDLLAVHKPTGSLWLIDYKTKESFGGDEDIEYVSQQPYYLWALQQMQVPVDRFALIEVKSTLPKRKPRKVRLDTESISGIRESVDGRFRWVPKLCSPTYLANLWKNLEVQARNMAAFRPEYSYVTRSPFVCSGCEFKQICDAELNGSDTQHVVQHNYAAPAPLRVLMEE